VRELSWGRVSRRDLIRWGLVTSAGLLAPIGGLNPFVSEASAAVGPPFRSLGRHACGLRYSC